MKSKLVVTGHFTTAHTSFLVDFEFTNNITILTGDSGTGKTAVFSFIRECAMVNSDILCFNYLDYQKDIREINAVYIEIGVIKIRKGLRVYSSRKIVLTEQEKEDYEKRIQKQVEKYERDLKCGGIDERGNFTRLHDRHAEH